MLAENVYKLLTIRNAIPTIIISIKWKQNNMNRYVSADTMH